jgi:hypothetical protein
MGIATTKSFADISEGSQVVVEVADATYDEEGRFGAAIELALEVIKPAEHAGDTILSTCGLSQSRFSKVRDLRNDGLDDEAIAAVLRNKGFEFEEIDDPETPRLGGALLRIVKACYDANARAVKKLLQECDGFDDLADALIGRRFVATTRKDKNDYTRIDGKGEFFRTMGDDAKDSGLQQKQEEASAAKKLEVVESEFNDIPF